jgi:dTDP-4-amino-4,6-dideoxygalactose transaminase
LRARLPFLRRWTEQRRAIAQKYRAGLRNAAFVVPDVFDNGHVHHLFPVLATNRTALIAHLASAGIETLIHYPVPIPQQPAVAATAAADCPVANRVCGQVLSLPLYPALTPLAVQQVISAAASFSG